MNFKYLFSDTNKFLLNISDSIWEITYTGTYLMLCKVTILSI
jgi:hypothetical protein